MPDPSLLIVCIQLSLATFLGLLVGTERSVAGKSAGMRTFGMVSLGSCLFVIVSLTVTNEYLGLVNFDPMRVPAGIVTGIGFLGAGMIIMREKSLRGLTSAAGLWTAAGIGMAVGFGLYTIAIFTTLLVLLLFTVLWYLEYRIKAFFIKDRPVVVEDSENI